MIAAEIWRLWQQSDQQEWLQWSRGVIAAEMRDHRRAHLVELVASMEPRRDRRGDR